MGTLLAAAVFALGACGDDDGEELSPDELNASLPAADELGLTERSESEAGTARDLFAGSLVTGAATNPGELATAIEDAGFQSAVGEDLEGENLNARIRAVQFDSEEGALEARDLLHATDLESPCPDACVVTPVEYELSEIPDSVAVHHVPTRGELPPETSAVEAHHAEFTSGPRLYVVQVDGKPSPTFSDDFDKLMQTVYDSASNERD